MYEDLAKTPTVWFTQQKDDSPYDQLRTSRLVQPKAPALTSPLAVLHPLPRWGCTAVAARRNLPSCIPRNTICDD
ncbi:hypothetical protein DENIT_11349 [Pseudomonas veronii]|nr:hypothetical protein DENIT_11349 [Pseudomonas veronii]